MWESTASVSAAETLANASWMTRFLVIHIYIYQRFNFWQFNCQNFDDFNINFMDFQNLCFLPVAVLHNQEVSEWLVLVATLNEVLQENKNYSSISFSPQWQIVVSDSGRNQQDYTKEEAMLQRPMKRVCGRSIVLGGLAGWNFHSF